MNTAAKQANFCEKTDGIFGLLGDFRPLLYLYLVVAAILGCLIHHMRSLNSKKATFMAIFAVIGFWAFLTHRGATSSDGDAYPLTTPVIRGDIEHVVLANGVVEASQQVNVGAQVSGQLKSLRVTLGETVRKGQLIAEIDAQTQRNVLEKARSSLAQMRAQLRSKQAQLAQAQLKLNREKRLRDVDASSHENYETARASWLIALADIDALKEQIDQAQITVDTELVNLGYTRILAPMDGTVVSIVTREGQTVNSTQLAPTIVVLAALETMTVRAQISEADVWRVQPEQAVYFSTLGNPDERFHSKLHAVELAPDGLEIDSKSTRNSGPTRAPVYFNASFDLPNLDHRLRIAMTGTASIILASAKDALLIPTTALRESRGDGVYQIEVLEVTGDKKRVVPRQIRVGIRNAWVQVLDGLQEGEHVVTEVRSGNLGPGAQFTHQNRS